MTLCLFLVIALSHAHNCTHKNEDFSLDYMKRLNIFFQDWAFGHRVAFKRLLRPFIISAGLHKRGARSLGDVQWGAMFALPSSGYWEPTNTGRYPAPVLRSIPILWEGPGSQWTTAPYTQASLGRRCNFGWLWLVKRERERERERLGDDDDDLLLRGGGGGGEGGLRRQEYAAWAVDSKAISWSFVQERGGFIYKSAPFFFFPPTVWSITQCQKTRNTITTTIIMILSLSL